MSTTEQILSQLPGNVWAGLQKADELWRSLRAGPLPVPTVVQTDSEPLAAIAWDVVICGGTLGILVGAVLVQRGWRVALVERGILQGREQEWNISRREVQTFVELGLLSAAELEQAIATEYNPARISFAEGQDLWVRDVLNVGIDPVFLLATLKQRFLAGGGHLLEHATFETATVHPNGVALQTSQAHLTTRLMLDGMGHFSPVVRQARQGQRPDAVCLVVGTCATGIPANTTGDLIAAFTPVQNQCQYFWEAFPARDGRTTYLFTYVDAAPDRPSLTDLFEDYFRLLPGYQGVELADLTIQRALFGFFPCYRQSPLPPQWDRILPIGDSSGSQSPLSFGGFGAMVRHLQRLTQGIHEALEVEALDQRSLGWLQPYQPNLSVTWLFQKAMSVGPTQTVAPDQITTLLTGIFQDMAALGDPVLKPFLQDVVQFPALFKTLTRTTLHHPGLVLQVIPHVGLLALIEWLGHYLMLAGYTALYPLGKQAAKLQFSPKSQFYLRRWFDALQYGTGNDYGGHGE